MPRDPSTRSRARGPDPAGSAADVGSGAGDFAFSNASDTVSQVAAQIQVAEQTSNVARGLAAAGAELDAARLEVEQEPDHTGREGSFQKRRQAITEKFRKQITGAEFQGDFDTRVNAFAERQLLGVREGVTRRRLDIAQGEMITAVDSLFTQAVQARTSGDRAFLVAQAKETLEKAEAAGSITAATKAQTVLRYEKLLEASELKRTALGVIDEIVASEADPSKRLARAREELGDADPLLLEHVEAGLKDRNAEEQAAKTEYEAALQDSLVRDAYDGKLKRADLIGRDLPAHIRSNVEGILSARDRSGTGEVVTDRDALARAQDLLRDPNQREQARAFDLNTLAPFISKLDLEALKKEQIAPDPGLEAVNAQIKEYGLGLYEPRPGGKTPAQYDIDRQWREQAEAAVERERRARGRKDLTDDEVETVLKRQRQSWYKSEWGRDPRKFRFQLPPIPATDQERLRASIKAAGQVPTVDAVEAEWRREQGYYEADE